MSRLRTVPAAVLLAFCTSLLSPSVQAGGDAREVARKAFPSTVLLLMKDKGSQPCSLASGFVVAPGVVATNMHVIDGAESGVAKVVGEKGDYAIEGVVGRDESRDLVLLRIPLLKAASLVLGDSSKMEVGQTVFAVGNPRGLEGTISQGIVSGLRDTDFGTLVQLTAPISPGSSGGPILGETGEVLGVAVATYRDGQNLNFAIPSNAVKSLLPPIEEAIVLAKSGSTGGKGILSTAGAKITDAVAGSKLSWNTNEAIQDRQEFAFSVKNGLQQAIKDVVCLVVFHDAEKEPIDFQWVTCRDVIPAGLAKRVFGATDVTVKRLTTRDGSNVRVRMEDSRTSGPPRSSHSTRPGYQGTSRPTGGSAGEGSCWQRGVGTSGPGRPSDSATRLDSMSIAMWSGRASSIPVDLR